VEGRGACASPPIARRRCSRSPSACRRGSTRPPCGAGCPGSAAGRPGRWRGTACRSRSAAAACVAPHLLTTPRPGCCARRCARAPS
jgi:hypothetical protein